MTRSAFLELLDEERSIPKGGLKKFKTVEKLLEMLKARKVLIEKAQACRDRGELTLDQYEQIVTLTRKNSLPE